MYVTIAIPFYNAEKYLLDAIKSVFMQTYQKWELILIDDGSTDRSLGIAKSINDPRVQVYADGKNKKLAARLNEVVELAKYDFIARMDADDLMLPQRIEILINLLQNKEHIDLVSCGVLSVKNNLILVGARGSNTTNYCLDGLLKRKQGFVHAALIAKKSWYLRNKYDESLPFAQDRDLWLNAASKNDFKAESIAQPLYIYREEGNVSARKLLKAYSLERKMFVKYSKRLPFSLLLNSFIKSIIVNLLNLFGQTHRLQTRRSSNIINDEYVYEYKQFIKKLKEFDIPLIKN